MLNSATDDGNDQGLAFKQVIFNCKHKWNHEINRGTAAYGGLAYRSRLFVFGGRMTLELRSLVIFPS